MVWVRSARALRLAAISARIASTAPSRPFGAPRARPDWAARAALTASSGPGLALPAPVLPAGAVDPGDPDAGGRQVPGKAGAVAAGAFDAGQADQTGTTSGCHKNLGPGRQIVSQDNPNGASRLGGQAGTQGPRPYAPARSPSGKPRQKHYPHSPCRLWAPSS